MRLIFSAVLILIAIYSIASTAKKNTSTDSRIKIALLDSGVNDGEYLCKDGHKDFTGKGLHDVYMHGSFIAQIISETMDVNKHCILNIKWFHDYKTYSRDYESIFKAAVEAGAKLINISAGGQKYSEEEKQLIENAVKRGVVVVVAAGNNAVDLEKDCKYYPACYEIEHKNFRVVSNYDIISNYGGPVTDREKISTIEYKDKEYIGTSISTAVVSSKLIKDLK